MCLTTGEDSSIVASGENALEPAIHIWDSNTLKN